MNKDVIEKIADVLFQGEAIPSLEALRTTYPHRELKEGAEVTRLCPSPTGFVHIGTIFAGLLCQFVARKSGGVYYLRIEDTDKKREVEGAKALIYKQLDAFEVAPDEGVSRDGVVDGKYGPYVQSERQKIYWAYVLELLKTGRAYPCFATALELEANIKDQQAKKVRPGYYGQWALWRDRSDEEVLKALQENKPFVLRFRALGLHESRIVLNDEIKGPIELPENDLDVPLLKSDELHLPTYHLAHVVDDYLMGTTLVMRGEEWLPSTSLHFELADALGIPRFRYAHIPVISIIDSNGGGKRKLSKRKDPEADVGFWLKQAYPLKSIKAYLLGLANSNFEEWYDEHQDADLSEFPFSLEKLKNSRSPLLDMKKVEDYAKDEIARLPQEKFHEEVLAWCEVHEPELYKSMCEDLDYTARVLAIERDGDKPRKDVAKWSDSPEQFSYFYDAQFDKQKVSDKGTASAEEIGEATAEFLASYDHSLDKDAWFEAMKQAAVRAGYCLDRKELKENPDKFKGGISDFAGIIRVQLTGKSRTPDLWTIMQIMGEERVRARLSS